MDGLSGGKGSQLLNIIKRNWWSNVYIKLHEAHYRLCLGSHEASNFYAFHPGLVLFLTIGPGFKVEILNCFVCYLDIYVNFFYFFQVSQQSSAQRTLQLCDDIILRFWCIERL